jgi:hypothetical protein
LENVAFMVRYLGSVFRRLMSVTDGARSCPIPNSQKKIERWDHIMSNLQIGGAFIPYLAVPFRSKGLNLDGLNTGCLCLLLFCPECVRFWSVCVCRYGGTLPMM